MNTEENEMSMSTSTPNELMAGGKSRGKSKRRGNASLRGWVAFVKKVQKEEKLSYRDAMMRAKVRKDKGEKWMGGGMEEDMLVVTPSGDMEEEEVLTTMEGGRKRRRRTNKKRSSKKRHTRRHRSRRHRR
jgi:hypothetical protein